MRLFQRNETSFRSFGGLKVPYYHLYGHDGHNLMVLDGPKLSCQPSIQWVDTTPEQHGYKNHSTEPSNP